MIPEPWMGGTAVAVGFVIVVGLLVLCWRVAGRKDRHRP